MNPRSVAHKAAGLFSLTELEKIMAFRYYIADIAGGEVIGTDNIAVAKEFANSDENFVIDTVSNEWILDSINRQTIKEQQDYKLDTTDDSDSDSDEK